MVINNQEEATLNVQESKDCLTNIRDTVRPFMDYIQEGKHRNRTEQDAMTQRKNIKGKWMDTLNKRKWAYYNMIRSRRIAEHYKHYLNREDPFIPKMFGSNKTPGETKEKTAIKFELAKTKVQTEIEILLLRGNKYEAEMRAKDTEIMAELGKNPNMEIREKLEVL